MYKLHDISSSMINACFLAVMLFTIIKYWLKLCVPYHFVSLTTLCPLSLCVPYHFVSLTTLCPLPLCVPYHFVSLTTLRPLPLCVAYHFVSLITLPVHLVSWQQFSQC